MSIYTVRYHAGPYRGTLAVQAEDSDTAIAKVRSSVRQQMTIPMYSDSYRIVSEGRGADDDEN